MKSAPAILIIGCSLLLLLPCLSAAFPDPTALYEQTQWPSLEDTAWFSTSIGLKDVTLAVQSTKSRFVQTSTGTLLTASYEVNSGNAVYREVQGWQRVSSTLVACALNYISSTGSGYSGTLYLKKITGDYSAPLWKTSGSMSMPFSSRSRPNILGTSNGYLFITTDNVFLPSNTRILWMLSADYTGAAGQPGLVQIATIPQPHWVPGIETYSWISSAGQSVQKNDTFIYYLTRTSSSSPSSSGEGGSLIVFSVDERRIVTQCDAINLGLLKRSTSGRITDFATIRPGPSYFDTASQTRIFPLIFSLDGEKLSMMNVSYMGGSSPTSQCTLVNRQFWDYTPSSPSNSTFASASTSADFATPTWLPGTTTGVFALKEVPPSSLSSAGSRADARGQLHYLWLDISSGKVTKRVFPPAVSSSSSSSDPSSSSSSCAQVSSPILVNTNPRLGPSLFAFWSDTLFEWDLSGVLQSQTTMFWDDTSYGYHCGVPDGVATVHFNQYYMLVDSTSSLRVLTVGKPPTNAPPSKERSGKFTVTFPNNGPPLSGVQARDKVKEILTNVYGLTDGDFGTFSWILGTKGTSATSVSFDLVIGSDATENALAGLKLAIDSRTARTALGFATITLDVAAAPSPSPSKGPSGLVISVIIVASLVLVTIITAVVANRAKRAKRTGESQALLNQQVNDLRALEGLHRVAIEFARGRGFPNPLANPVAITSHAADQFRNALSRSGYKDGIRELLNKPDHYTVGFHGTNSVDAICGIFLNNFDPKKRNNQVYGPGEYFDIDKGKIATEFSKKTECPIIAIIIIKDASGKPIKEYKTQSYHKSGQTIAIVNNPLRTNYGSLHAFNLPCAVASTKLLNKKVEAEVRRRFKDEFDEMEKSSPIFIGGLQE